MTSCMYKEVFESILMYSNVSSLFMVCFWCGVKQLFSYSEILRAFSSISFRHFSGYPLFYLALTHFNTTRCGYLAGFFLTDSATAVPYNAAPPVPFCFLRHRAHKVNCADLELTILSSAGIADPRHHAHLCSNVVSKSPLSFPDLKCLCSTYTFINEWTCFWNLLCFSQD